MPQKAWAPGGVGGGALGGFELLTVGDEAGSRGAVDDCGQLALGGDAGKNTSGGEDKEGEESGAFHGPKVAADPFSNYPGTPVLKPPKNRWGVILARPGAPDR